MSVPMQERIRTFQDILRVLEEQPSLREQLRVLLLSRELLDLPRMVASLVEAVSRLDQQVARLAEAQARTEERVGRLEEAVARLAEAQARTEARVQELAEAVDRLQREVGTLSNVVGGSIESDLDDVLPYVMRQKSYRILAEPQPISLDGEVDVVLPVQSPDGRDLWVVAEAKVRLRRGDVFHLATQLADAQWRERMQRAGIVPPYLPYAYGMRVYPDAVTAAETTGIGVLSPRGEVLAPKEVS